jgi:Fe-S cluster assembly ATPase SufC
MAILDEIDSGLDIDALRDVSMAVNGLRKPDRAVLMITHYQARSNIADAPRPELSECMR